MSATKRWRPADAFGGLGRASLREVWMLRMGASVKVPRPRSSRLPFVFGVTLPTFGRAVSFTKEISTMQRVGLLVITGLVLLAWFTWLISRSAAGVPKHIEAQDHGHALRVDGSSVVVAAEGSGERTVLMPDAITESVLRVSDSENQARIKGARICAGAKGLLSHPSRGLAILGHTDGAGEYIVVDCKMLAEKAIIVQHPGFISARIDGIREGQTYDVTMARAARVVFDVVDVGGRGLSDVTVMAYGSTVDAASVMGDEVGLHEVSTFRRGAMCAEAVTDANGRAVLEMPPGKYSVACKIKWHFMEKGPLNMVAPMPGDSPVTICLREFVGAVWDVGPEMGASVLAITERHMLGNWVQARSLLAGCAAQAAKREVEDAVPGRLAVVLPCVPRAGMDAAAPEARIGALVDGRGWIYGAAKLTSLRSLKPNSLDLSESSKEAMGEVFMQYEGSVPYSELYQFVQIAGVRGRPGEPALKLPLNRSAWIPEGEYVIGDTSGHRRLAAFVVQTRERATVRLTDMELGACVRLSITIAGNSNPWGTKIVLRRSDVHAAPVAVSPLSPRRFPLMMESGTYSIRVEWGNEVYKKDGVVLREGLQLVDLVWE